MHDGVQAKCRGAGRIGPALCRDGCRAGEVQYGSGSASSRRSSGWNSIDWWLPELAQTEVSAWTCASTAPLHMARTSGMTPVHAILARALLSPFRVQAEAAWQAAPCRACRSCVRPCNPCHCRETRRRCETSAALGSPTGEAHAITGVPGRETAETHTGPSGVAVAVGARRPATDHATLETARPDARRTGVHGHALAARGGARISRGLPVRGCTA